MLITLAILTLVALYVACRNAGADLDAAEAAAERAKARDRAEADRKAAERSAKVRRLYGIK